MSCDVLSLAKAILADLPLAGGLHTATMCSPQGGKPELGCTKLVSGCHLHWKQSQTILTDKLVNKTSEPGK